MGRRRWRCVFLALLVGGAFAVAAVAGHLDALTAGLAYLGPAALAFLLLVSGHYPGERRLLGLVRTVARRSPLPGLGPGSRRTGRLPRGGLLVASSLAGRAPPLVPRPR